MNKNDMVEVEDGIVEETKEEKLPEKIGKYVKSNWKKIAVAVGAVAIGALGFSWWTRHSDVIVYDLPPESTEDDVEENSSTPEE